MQSTQLRWLLKTINGDIIEIKSINLFDNGGKFVSIIDREDSEALIFDGEEHKILITDTIPIIDDYASYSFIFLDWNQELMIIVDNLLRSLGIENNSCKKNVANNLMKLIDYKLGVIKKNNE